jgi:Flp pilus assembly protein TadG
VTTRRAQAGQSGSPAARRRRGGQTLVEFALLLPLFVLLLFAVVDGGRLIYQNSVVSQAAREGARQASVEAGWIGSTDSSCGTANGPVCPAAVASGSPSLEEDVQAAANRMTTPFGSIGAGHLFISCNAQGSAPTGSWTGVSCASNSPSDVVSVRVEMEYTSITPVIGQILGPMWLSGASTMVIN